MWDMIELLILLWAVASVVLPVVSLIKTLRQARKIDDLTAQVEYLQRVLNQQTQSLPQAIAPSQIDSALVQPMTPPPLAITALPSDPVTQSIPVVSDPRSDPHAPSPADARTSIAAVPPSLASPVATGTAPTISSRHNDPTFTASAKGVGQASFDESALPIVTSLWHSVRQWLLGENVIVRIGALVLLVGVVLLLKLATEYVDIPIALRMAGVALAGLAVIAVGYRTTHKRRGYGLTLQGVGFAMIYLTIFISFRLYGLLPPGLTFGLLAVLAGLTVAFSVWQNALPLAVLALGSAFVAPLLASQPHGSVVMLFGYYLLLNCAVALIGNYRPWKLLNALSVMVTFGLAYVWGFNTYQVQGDWQSLRWQLFGLVVAHMALYVLISVRYAEQVIAYNRDTPEQPPLIALDMGLLFGTALLGFGLFASLLNDLPKVLALVSAGLSALYLGLGFWLVRRQQQDSATPLTGLLEPANGALVQRYGLLIEAALALGMGFLALVLPLALTAQWSLIGWAVQGAALVWLGERTARRWGVVIGLILQALSAWVVLNFDSSQAAWHRLLDQFAIAHRPALEVGMALPLVMVCASVLVSAYVLRFGMTAGTTSVTPPKRGVGKAFDGTRYLSATAPRFLPYGLMVVAAVLYVASIDAIFANVGYVSDEQSLSLAYAVLVAAALLVGQGLHQRHGWPAMHQVSRWVLPVSLCLWVWVWQAWFPVMPSQAAWDDWRNLRQLSAVPGLTTAWLMSVPVTLLALLQGAWLLRQWRHEPERQDWDQAGFVLVLILMLTGMWQSLAYPPQVIGGDGMTLLFILPTVMALGVLLGLGHMRQQPANTRLAQHIAAYTSWFAPRQVIRLTAYVLVPLTVLWLLVANYSLSGHFLGVYVPVLNPLDLLLLAILLYIGHLAAWVPIAATGTNQMLNQTRSQTHNQTWHQGLLGLFALLGFVVLTGMLVRGFAYVLGTRLLVDGGWHDGAVQTGLTILWSLLAMGLMFVASRRAYRPWWFMGVSLLALVVLKLVIIDMSSVGAVLRVVSFIGAGLLMLVIGYLAPLPPKLAKLASKIPND